MLYVLSFVFFFFKQKTAYEMRISDWSSDVCSSDLLGRDAVDEEPHQRGGRDRRLHRTVHGHPARGGLLRQRLQGTGHAAAHGGADGRLSFLTCMQARRAKR